MIQPSEIKDTAPNQYSDYAPPLSYADLRRFSFIVFGAIFLALLAGAVAKVLLLFAIAFFIAAVLNTPVAWLAKRGVKRPLAVILVMLITFGVGVGVLWLVVPTILEQANDLVKKAPTYGVRIQSQVEKITEQYPSLDRIIPESDKILEEVQTRAPGFATGLVSRTLGWALGIFGGLFLGLLAFLLTVFILMNPTPLVVGVLGATPARHRAAASRSIERFMQQMGAWARATIIMGLITGISTGVLLHFIGVQPALLFGTLACFGELVPNIGPVIAAVPALFVAAGEGPSTLGWAIAAILFVQQVESNVLVPYIMGSQMELHPVSIIFFALTMGTLFGLAGAILAVPTAATIKILYDEFYLKDQQISQDRVETQAANLTSGTSA